MKGMLMKFNSKVVPLSDEDITDVETYHSCLHTLHSQAVIEARLNFVPNRVLGASLSNISPLESTVSCLGWAVHTCPVASDQCQLLNLNTYKGRITTGISDVCLECGVIYEAT